MGWSRRTFNVGALAAAATSVVGCGSRRSDSGSRAVAPPTLRGVLLITADDLGWRDVGALGLTAAETPALDRLHAEGASFSRAFDVVSSCSSSRATYVTGQYPHTHGVTGLVHRFPELSLDPSHPTIIRQLAAAGFETAIQGKWHLSFVEPPEAFGYDRYLDTDVDQLIRTSQDAALFLEAHTQAPFYLELNFMQPHRDPFGAFPQSEAHPVAPDDASPPAWWGLPDWPEIREEVAGYLSRIRWMDALIGEILDTLDRVGLAEDTLVAFISDNGPPFPGLKQTLYDRGTGTPLVFRWPGVIPAVQHDTLVSSVDLAPTLLDLAGAEPLPAAQGRSLAPLLRGEAWTPDAALLSEMELHASEKPARAVRTEQYKYIRNYSDAPWGGEGGDWTAALAQEPGQTFDEPRVPEELYDLVADPLERDNLIDSPAHAAILAELKAQLQDIMARTADPRLGT